MVVGTKRRKKSKLVIVNAVRQVAGLREWSLDQVKTALDNVERGDRFSLSVPDCSRGSRPLTGLNNSASDTLYSQDDRNEDKAGGRGGAEVGHRVICGVPEKGRPAAAISAAFMCN
ncbi:hypothetical protein BaRGS_00036636 [Batillaria attramentaria]|uniref:Uncharacterized protein n=1 Tax=Batillaria attramentaria TaxID=370345 RepID=A0ABD0JB90_9CAEN